MSVLLNLSFVQIGALITIALAAYPTVRILHRMGYSGWWALIAAIPLGGFVGLWILAFSDWPVLGRNSN